MIVTSQWCVYSRQNTDFGLDESGVESQLCITQAKHWQARYSPNSLFLAPAFERAREAESLKHISLTVGHPNLCFSYILMFRLIISHIPLQRCLLN